MHLTVSDVAQLNEQRLLAFLRLAIDEGPYLDYKEAMSGGSPKDSKREFLKDVTGFANAAGGLLLIGVREPDAAVEVEQQLVGIDDGEAIAQNLERVAASCVDPRIPGLLIRSVPLSTGRACVIAHVPSSLGRPHMVQHEGHRSFYVRHSESTGPMTTHELREAVLTSASAEMRARSVVARRLDGTRHKVAKRDMPAFFLQATPLIAPLHPWNVLGSKVDAVLRSGAGRQGNIRLSTGCAPRPTIDGALTVDDREDTGWEIEVHRTGYVSLLCWNSNSFELNPKGAKCPVIFAGHGDLFPAFAALLAGILKSTETDVPYLVTCAYLKAQGSYLGVRETWKQYAGPYTESEIMWPEYIRATGGDFQLIAQQQATGLAHAFGERELGV